MNEFMTGNAIPVRGIGYLWAHSLAQKLVNQEGFVTDDNGVVKLGQNYAGILKGPDIVRLVGPVNNLAIDNELRNCHGAMFVQRCITMRQATHYMLYDGAKTFLFNPKPDYAIAGEQTWYIYGVKNDV